MQDSVRNKITVGLYVLVIFLMILGMSYAYTIASVATNVATGTYGIDESIYGNTSFDSSNINFFPILDTDAETSDSVLKIDFKVRGAQNNPTNKNIIYDIALVDLVVDCELLNGEHIKWKLVKNNTEISSGSLSYSFDTIKDGRLVLTTIQQDLIKYNSGYDSFSFYLWFSDSCQEEDITNCTLDDQSDILSRYIAGKVEVELYTDSKKELVRKPRSVLDTNTCFTERLLSTAEVGSYVKYSGTSGCIGNSCDGQNANYEKGVTNGYCTDTDTSTEFKSNGWRIAYIKNGVPHLISAGAPECLASKSTGVTSNITTTGYETTAGLPLHLANLSAAAQRYCNPMYSNGGVCNTSTAWVIGDTDYNIMTKGGTLSVAGCLDSNKTTCGDTANDLIANGSKYWIRHLYDDSSNTSYYNKTLFATWGNGNVGHNWASFANGVRPIIKLDTDLLITGGSGTEEDPYIIKNPNYTYELLKNKSVGSYVKYNGNNGCTGNLCKGANVNVSSTYPGGFCYNNDGEIYQFAVDGFRLAYLKSGYMHLISAGSQQCLGTCKDLTHTVVECADSEAATGTPTHFAALDSNSAKYCNASYTSGGVCNTSTVWQIDGTDFTAMTGSTLSACRNTSKAACGLGNDLIDNGGYYHFATTYGTTYGIYNWGGKLKYVANSVARLALGVRPVIKLDPAIYILGGNGSADVPYIIDNPNTVRDLSGNLNNGVLKGATWNKNDGTLTTDGVDDYVNLGMKNYDFGSNVTMVSRVKFNVLPSSGQTYEFFGNWDGGGFGFVLGNDTNNGYYIVFDPYTTGTGGYVWSPASFNNIVVGKWYTLVGTYNGSKVNLYLDGKKVSSVDSSGSIKTSGAFMALGANPGVDSADSSFSSVTYDYALIYDRAISASEVADNFSNNELVDSEINKKDLLVYYDFK